MSHRWRFVVHALDRTGPPVLALTFARWMLAEHPDDEIEVIAFRGGELLDEFVRLGPVIVLLDPEEPWDWRRVDDDRVARLRPRFAMRGKADATLLISVAAAQCLPFLLVDQSPIVTWVVEEGEEYPAGLAAATRRWLAGAVGTRDDVLRRLGSGIEVHVVPEFVAPAAPRDPQLITRCRTALGAGPDDLLVVGAGIATTRKAPDLFLEVASAHRRATGRFAKFTWLGGQRDPLFHRVCEEARRLGLDDVRFFANVTDIGPWLAAADVFLHPARLDSFPNVCLHAAMAGTPVVAFSGAGGVPEMLGASFVGAPYPDVAGLASRVAELGDPSQRAATGAAQQRHVESRFTPAVGGSMLVEHLRSMAEK